MESTRGSEEGAAMKLPVLAMAIVVLAAVMVAGAQILFKRADPHLDTSLFSNYGLFIGIGLYVVAFVIMLAAYRMGDVSILSPIMALSNFAVILLAYFFLKESLTVHKLAGGVLIFIGIMVMNI